MSGQSDIDTEDITFPYSPRAIRVVIASSHIYLHRDNCCGRSAYKSNARLTRLLQKISLATCQSRNPFALYSTLLGQQFYIIKCGTLQNLNKKISQNLIFK